MSDQILPTWILVLISIIIVVLLFYGCQDTKRSIALCKDRGGIWVEFVNGARCIRSEYLFLDEE